MVILINLTPVVKFCKALENFIEFFFHQHDAFIHALKYSNHRIKLINVCFSFLQGRCRVKRDTLWVLATKIRLEWVVILFCKYFFGRHLIVGCFGQKCIFTIGWSTVSPSCRMHWGSSCIMHSCNFSFSHTSKLLLRTDTGSKSEKNL